MNKERLSSMMERLAPWGCLVVSTGQFVEGLWVGGFGWLSMAVLIWLHNECERAANDVIRGYKELLDKMRQNEAGK